MKVKISIIKNYKDGCFPDEERIRGLEHSIANLLNGINSYQQDWINSLKILSTELRILLIDKDLKRNDAALLYEILNDGGYRIFITVEGKKLKNASLKDFMTSPCFVSSKNIEWTPSTVVYEYANKWGGVHNDRDMSEKYQMSCGDQKIVGPINDYFVGMPTLSYYLCHTAFVIVKIGTEIIRDLIKRDYLAQRIWYDDKRIGQFEKAFANILPIFDDSVKMSWE